jgi:hypothetical protein
MAAGKCWLCACRAAFRGRAQLLPGCGLILGSGPGFALVVLQLLFRIPAALAHSARLVRGRPSVIIVRGGLPVFFLVTRTGAVRTVPRVLPHIRIVHVRIVPS